MEHNVEFSEMKLMDKQCREIDDNDISSVLVFRFKQRNQRRIKL